MIAFHMMLPRRVGQLLPIFLAPAFILFSADTAFQLPPPLLTLISRRCQLSADAAAERMITPRTITLHYATHFDYDDSCLFSAAAAFRRR